MIERPGGLQITEEALRLMELAPGARILEIGCGAGDTAAYLADRGFRVTAVDTDEKKVRAATARLQGKADVCLADGECLEEFPSKTFDGVIMECVLSLIPMPEEALHEAYCVLKDGGSLYLSDMMVKGTVLSGQQSGGRGICGESAGAAACTSTARPLKPSSFRSEGRLLPEPLAAELAALGFSDIRWQDRSRELDDYAAQLLMDGTFPDCWKAKPADGCGTGYFLLTARKGDARR